MEQSPSSSTPAQPSKHAQPSLPCAPIKKRVVYVPNGKLKPKRLKF